MLTAEAQFRVSSLRKAANLCSDVDYPTDHDLMIAVRAGEIQRLADLFERYQRKLYGFFLRMTNQPAVSEDLVQTVFQRILKYRHTYRDEGKFTAWIYHLARTVAADHFRKTSSAALPTDPANLVDQPDPGPQPAELAALAEETALLRDALAHLPVAQRELIVLSRLQRLDHKEIARLLDCSIGAVKVRSHRALQDLRKLYFKMRNGDNP